MASRRKVIEETWVARLIHAALKIQSKLSAEVPIEIRKAGAGRKGRLVIESEDGGVFYLRWDGRELIEDDEETDVRNEFYMHSQTLLDLITGELGTREAIAARLIRITGDRSIYDTEDIMNLLEQLQTKIKATILRRGKSTGWPNWLVELGIDV